MKPPKRKRSRRRASSSRTASRQTLSVTIHPERRSALDVDLALVNVTVTDPYNRLVTGLEQDNFRVFEDNIEQEMVTFSSEDVPISIGVIFDFSGSMSNKIEQGARSGFAIFQDRQSAG